MERAHNETEENTPREKKRRLDSLNYSGTTKSRKSDSSMDSDTSGSDAKPNNRRLAICMASCGLKTDRSNSATLKESKTASVKVTKQSKAREKMTQCTVCLMVIIVLNFFYCMIILFLFFRILMNRL